MVSRKILPSLVTVIALVVCLREARRSARLRQIDLHALHRRRRHDDEDDQQHVGEIQHRRDVDVVIWLGVGLEAAWPVTPRPADRRSRLGAACIELRHPRHEILDEDLHVGGQILDAGDQIVVAEQRRDRDAEAGDRGDQRGGDARRDRVDIDVSATRRSPRK